MGELNDLMDRGRREAPANDDAFDRLLRLRDRRRRNGRLLSAAVAAVVVAAGVVGGLVVLGHGTRTGVGPGDSTIPDTQPAPSTTSGSGTPTTAPSGGSTAGGANLVAGPGQYDYWEFVYVLDSGNANMTYWYSPASGTGHLKTSTTTDGFGVLPDQDIRLGKFPLGDDLSGLSADPNVLLEQLLERNAEDGRSPQPDVTPGSGQEPSTGGLVRAVEDLLGYDAPHASPTLRAALYEVLRGLPTAQDLGSATDPAGRPAVAIRITTEALARTFYFDPQNHLFMAEELRLAPGIPVKGPADLYPTYLIVQAGGITDSLGHRPAPGQMFFPEAKHLPEVSGPGPSSTVGGTD